MSICEKSFVRAGFFQIAYYGSTMLQERLYSRVVIRIYRTKIRIKSQYWNSNRRVQNVCADKIKEDLNFKYFNTFNK